MFLTRFPQPRLLTLVVALAMAFTLLPACSVQKDKGGKQDVNIKTPVGDMHVTTEADVKDVGLPLYPGAQPKPKAGHDESSANVNISTSFFGLKVVALEYLSDDPPEKVQEFYKKELAKYGAVLECHSSHKPGTVIAHKRGEGELTCGKDAGDTLELKVGTEERQHIVSIKPSGKGTAFALVYVNTRGKESL